MVVLETWTNLAEKMVNEAENKLSRIRQQGLDKWLNRETTYQELREKKLDDLSLQSKQNN